MRALSLLLPVCLVASGCTSEKDPGDKMAPQTAESIVPVGDFVAADVASNAATAEEKASGSGGTGPMSVTGEFDFASNMDEGTFFNFRPDAATRKRYPTLPNDGLVIENIDAASKIMKIPQPEADGGNSYHCTGYSGKAAITISDLKKKMVNAYGEEEQEQRTFATLVSMESKNITLKECTDLEGVTWSHEPSAEGFKSLEEVVRLTSLDHPQGELDTRKGVYSLGVSEVIYLPKPGAPVYVRTGISNGKDGGEWLEIHRMSGGKAAVSPILGCEATSCFGYSLVRSGDVPYILEKKTGDKWFYVDGAFKKQ